MNKHEYNIFPEMLAEDYNRLKSDISNNGYDLKYPIWLYEDKIIDGWNRQRVCDELKVQPIYKDFVGSDIEAINFVMRTNKRRNLTSTQWACVAVEAEDLIFKLKEETERHRREKQALTQSNGAITQLIVEQPIDRTKNETASKVAEVFNTNRTYVNEAARFKKEDPDKFELLKRGEKTITEFKKEEKKEQRDQFIQKQREDIASGKAVLAEGVFEIIAIDPPWAYEEKGGFSPEQHDADGNRGGVDYPTLTVEQIKELKLPLADEGVVFLWTTHAFLKDAFDILNAWDLNYKCTIVWDKESMGMGRTIRLQCEFCLLAFKGKPIFEGSAERDIIRSKRREHSRKPDEFYELVERTTVGRRLEYFSREQRNGWEIYGNNTNQF